MKTLAGLFCGLLFGTGLVVSGMGHPAKVLNFLDIAGSWDPSLAFVMGGAVVTAFFGYRVVLGRDRPLLATGFRLPSKTDVDARLLTGAGLFGAGWGLGGLCPGPAFVALGPALFSSHGGIVVFFVAMMVGMGIAKIQSTRRTATA